MAIMYYEVTTFEIVTCLVIMIAILIIEILLLRIPFKRIARSKGVSQQKEAKLGIRISSLLLILLSVPFILASGLIMLAAFFMYPLGVFMIPPVGVILVFLFGSLFSGVGLWRMYYSAWNFGILEVYGSKAPTVI